jgi:hypothetical protein
MNRLLKSSVAFLVRAPRFYLHPDRTIKLRDEKTGYYLDPVLQLIVI